MSENALKNIDLFPKAQDNKLKCLVLATTQKWSVYCHRGGKKAENIHIEEQGSYTLSKVRFKYLSSIFKVHYSAFPASYNYGKLHMHIHIVLVCTLLSTIMFIFYDAYSIIFFILMVEKKFRLSQT